MSAPPRRGLFAAGGLVATGLGLLVFVFATMQTHTQTSLELASEARHRASQLTRRATHLNRRIIAIDNEAEVVRLEWQVRELTIVLRRISREFGIPLPPLPLPLLSSPSPEPTPGPLPIPTPSVSPPPLPTPTPTPTPPPCLPDPIGCLPVP